MENPTLPNVNPLDWKLITLLKAAFFNVMSRLSWSPTTTTNLLDPFFILLEILLKLC